MADWLLTRLPPAPEIAATWLVVDARGVPSGPPQSGPLALAAPRAAGRRVCVLVPGAEVLLAEPEVPVRAGAKVQQLVPYALEEHLAEDIDELHFAVGKRIGESARAPVAVVARAPIEAWLATHPEAAAAVAAWRSQSELIQARYGAVADEETPDRLSMDSIARLACRRRNGWLAVASAAARMYSGSPGAVV